ncbi:transposase [Gulosibacter chungangensis]|uniref:Transposase n=1 Tax=Gulosibacter chungangensis TaxID=979746 RepID=A0A7J5BC07_9MICO|nr:transposase [Gulosibacter chungangensis]KAB1643507.1 transposase [Gulosibacter chungangensis]
MPAKYSKELKSRAVELVLHAQSDPETAHGANQRIAEELGLNSETLRGWVAAYKRSKAANTPVKPVDLEAENRRLRAELADHDLVIAA